MLGDQTNLAAQAGQGHPGDINPVDDNPAGIRVGHAQQQMSDGGFAGAVGAGNGHRLTGDDMQVQSLQHRFAVRVAEIDSLKLNGARDRGQGGFAPVRPVPAAPQGSR